MKVAIVGQPFDTVIPPGQNSVGICTYDMAMPLSERCDVRVFGVRDYNAGSSEGNPDPLAFTFFPASRKDKLAYKLRNKCSRFIDIRSPVSTDGWLFADYGQEVAQYIHENRFDVVHIQHSSQYAPVIRALNPDVKIVLHLHAEWFTQSNYKVLGQRLESVDLVTTVSDFVGSTLRKTFPSIAGRCVTVYNGVNSHQFIAEKDWAASAARSRKRILFVGAVSPHLGVHILVEAFRIVAAEFPQVQLDIIGSQSSYPIEEMIELTDWQTVESLAPYYRRGFLSTLKTAISRGRSKTGSYVEMLKDQLGPDLANRVHFVGAVANRAELIRRYYEADLFSFSPVFNHGFGLPAVEAMAAGTPVVSSRSGAVSETVVDGQTGILVPKGDPEALAKGICDLLRDDARRITMGKAGRKRVLKDFSWEVAAAKFYRLYRQLSDSKQIPQPALLGSNHLVPKDQGDSLLQYQSLFAK